MSALLSALASAAISEKPAKKRVWPATTYK